MKSLVAVAQIDSKLGDVRSNVAKHVHQAERASREGADLIVFPELSLTGYSLRDLTADVAVSPETDPLLKPLRLQSKRIVIIAGCVVSGEDHGLYNAAVCFEGGEVRHVHRKVYPPTYGLFEEGRYFSSGKNVRAFTSSVGRVGMLICEDMWHPSLPYLLSVDGAETIVTLTASPTRVGANPAQLENKTVNHDHQRSYARLFSVYSVFSNRVGVEDGVNFWGGSAVFSPRGDTLAESPLFEEDLLLTSLDTAEITRARRASRHVLDERPELAEANLRSILDGARRGLADRTK